jgi:hypothetical protein
MIRPRAMIKAAVGYVRKNPDEVVRAAANATVLRFGVPLASLRWFAGQIRGKRAPKEVEISSAPPALRLSAIVDAMGTPVRASAAIKIDEILISESAVRVGVRLRDVKLALVAESDSPVAMLIKSGALDLSNPGNLINFIPKKPAMVIEADGDRVVVDLMKAPKLANNPRIKKLLGIFSPILGIRAIETDHDHLYVNFRATPTGLLDSVNKLRSAI